MPDDFTIIKGGSADISELAKIHVDCWRTTYRGIMPDEKLDSLSYESSSEKFRDIFIEKREAILQDTVLIARYRKKAAGFCLGGMNRKQSKKTQGYSGEIKAVYILKNHQRKGLGTVLLKKFEEIFRKKGIFSYIIWVLKDNSAKEFYKKFGGKLITTKTYEIGGRKLKGLCFGFRITGGDQNEF